jgi:hypothetical protein
VGWVARAQGQGRAQSGRLGRGWGVGTDSEEGAADGDGGVMATGVAESSPSPRALVQAFSPQMSLFS